MKVISKILSLLIFSLICQEAFAQSKPDSLKLSKDISVFLGAYSKATTTIDTIWLKTNLADSFQYSDPLNYNLNRADYIALYSKGVYKISKAEASIHKIRWIKNQTQVLVMSDIQGDANGQAVSGTYPFIFKLEPKDKSYKIRSIEVSQ